LSGLHILGQTKHFSSRAVEGKKGVNAVEKASKVIAALGPSQTPVPLQDCGGWLTYKPVEGFEGLPQFNIGPIKAGIGPRIQ